MPNISSVLITPQASNITHWRYSQFVLSSLFFSFAEGIEGFGLQNYVIAADFQALEGQGLLIASYLGRGFKNSIGRQLQTWLGNESSAIKAHYRGMGGIFTGGQNSMILLRFLSEARLSHNCNQLGLNE
ncbi:MAG: hypothetical protein BWY75_01791 [bacterium ADurb.Bin425]|nr:MAG: hypothetical protein BWY75_01791 [bacterium ADurb.Bin425]